MRRSFISKLLLVGAMISSGVVALSAAATTATPAAASLFQSGVLSAGGVAPQIIVGRTFAGDAPPPNSTCIADYGIACYSPSDMQAQYNFPSWGSSNTGSGQTIVIFDSFGSPTITSDLATFDAAFNLPAPPSFNIYQPEGNVTYNYMNVPSSTIQHNVSMQVEIGWAFETTLDVEWAHAMAPGANIALVETPIPESLGVQGLTNLENAQMWALQNHLGNIWSDSWAATEQSFRNSSVLAGLDHLYAMAASQGVSVFFATGDSGVSNSLTKQGVLAPGATVNYPSSSPNVISVGGTEIPTPVNSISTYQPEAAWNDEYGAGGGGYSSVFSEPSFQTAAGIADSSGMRGVPDVSYNAAGVSSIWIYESFFPFYTGWTAIAGTSAAAPQWAAVAALANQADGPLGFLAPRLYQIASNSAEYASAFHDITVGMNGPGGYSASTGWDPATGLGTPNVTNLITALATTTP